MSWPDRSLARTLSGIRKLVRETVRDLSESGEPVREPIGLRRYSGKFLVGVPPQVHRKLAMEAAESGVSINRLVSSKPI